MTWMYRLCQRTVLALCLGLLAGCSATAINDLAPVVGTRSREAAQRTPQAALRPLRSSPQVTQTPAPTHEIVYAPAPVYSIFDTVIDSESLTLAAGMLFRADPTIEAILSGAGPVSFFVPSDAALSRLPADVLDRLISDPILLDAVLRYSVVPHAVPDLSRAAAAPSSLPTLYPDGDLTLQFRSDQVPGDGTADFTVDAVPVIGAPISATNGAIYTLDGILYPEAVAGSMPGTLWDVLTRAGSYDRFLTAVETAHMAVRLRQDGAMTLFVPTDAAFHRLPGETQRAFMTDFQAAAGLVLAHMLPEQESTTDLEQSPALLSVLGRLTPNSPALHINRIDRKLVVDGGSLIRSDLPALNGVIHIVDRVLVPPLIDSRMLLAEAAPPAGLCPWRSLPLIQGCFCVACSNAGTITNLDACQAACGPTGNWVDPRWER